MIDPQTVQQVLDFHGHLCPGVAMGIRAAAVALDRVGAHSQDQHVVAIVETDVCAVDAIQVMTGCTLGKGNLLHHDHGKNVYTFVRRSDGRAIRLSALPGAWLPHEPALRPAFQRMREGRATAADFVEIDAHRDVLTDQILSVPEEALYIIRDVDVVIPRLARTHVAVVCSSCGEPTMETRIRRSDGRNLCPPCFEEGLSRIEKEEEEEAP